MSLDGNPAGEESRGAGTRQRRPPRGFIFGEPMTSMRKKLQALRIALGAKGLRLSDVRLVLALFMFTSLQQKRECLAALDRLEALNAKARAKLAAWKAP